MGHDVNSFKKFNIEIIQLFIEDCYFTNSV